MPEQRTRRWQDGNFTAADWTDDERRVAVAQVMRLAGLPDTDSFTELS